MSSAIQILGELVASKMVIGTEDDARAFAKDMGWRVEAIEPSGGLRRCFTTALQAGAPHVMILEKGVRSSGTGLALQEIAELAKLLDHPFDAISLGTCVDGSEALASWGACDNFKRAAGFQYAFETNCTCNIGTIYSTAYMQRYIQRTQAPDRAYAFVPELLLRAKDTRPIRQMPAIVYDPYGRVILPRDDACRHHPLLAILALACLIFLKI
jgi:hypothetical protein